MASAKSIYREICTKILSQHFTSLGWKQRGYSWQYEDEESGAFIDIYVETYYVVTDDEVRFTIGMDAWDRECFDWLESLRGSPQDQPTESPGYTGPKFIDEQGRWIAKIEKHMVWTATSDTEPEQISEKILEHVSDFTNNFFLEHTAVNDVMRQLLSQHRPEHLKLNLSERSIPRFGLSYYELLLPVEAGS